MYIFQPDRYLLQKQLEMTAKFLNGKMLDIGAGEMDRYSKYFSVSEIVRMDISKNPNIDVVGSADNIPFPDNSFDSALCTQVFEHLKFPEKAAREIFRVLKKGGSVAVTVPQMNELHEEPNDFFRYTKYGIESIFHGAGFETVFCDQRGGYYSMVAQIKTRRWVQILDLYHRPIIGKILGKIVALYGKIMIGLDRLDKSESNRRHAIGWCFVFKKL